MMKARWLPQSGQKYRVASGVDFSSAGVPFVQDHAAVGKVIHVTAGAACTRRQIVQWQWKMRSGSPSAW